MRILRRGQRTLGWQTLPYSTLSCWSCWQWVHLQDARKLTAEREVMKITSLTDCGGIQVQGTNLQKISLSSREGQNIKSFSLWLLASACYLQYWWTEAGFPAVTHFIICRSFHSLHSFRCFRLPPLLALYFFVHFLLFLRILLYFFSSSFLSFFHFLFFLPNFCLSLCIYFSFSLSFCVTFLLSVFLVYLPLYTFISPQLPLQLHK
jgi:hypothetical protein